MLCDLCGENEAVLFIEQTNANTKRKLNLCFECAFIVSDIVEFLIFWLETVENLDCVLG